MNAPSPGCPRGPAVVAGIEFAIGVALTILGPTSYDISYCYSYYCYGDDYLKALVASGGGVCILASVLLFCGLGCRSVCVVRLSMSLTFLTALDFIACGIISIQQDVGTGLAIMLFVIAAWLFCSVGIIARQGPIVRIPVASNIIVTVPTPAPQTIVQPTIQNNYINQTTIAPNIQNQNQAPSTQPQDYHNAPSPPHPYNNYNQSPQARPSDAHHAPPQPPSHDVRPPPQPYYSQDGLPAQPPPQPYYRQDGLPAQPPPQPYYSQDGLPAQSPPQPYYSQDGPPEPPPPYYNSQDGAPAQPAQTYYPPLPHQSDPEKPTRPNDTPTSGNTDLPYPLPPHSSPHDYVNPHHVTSPPRPRQNSEFYSPPIRSYDHEYDRRRRSMYSDAHPPDQEMYGRHQRPPPHPANSGYNAHRPRY